MRDEQLERVSANIRDAVVAFCRDRLQRRHTRFYMADLGDFVSAAAFMPVAPDSPGRVLRDLRKDGVVDYRVVNRAESLYELLRA